MARSSRRSPLTRLLGAAALAIALLLTCLTAQAQSEPTGAQNLRAEVLPGGGIVLGWDAPAADAATVTGYRVLRSVGASAMTILADTGSDDTTYTDAFATTPGETYGYQVLAMRGAETSEVSNTVSVSAPQAPASPRSTGSTRNASSAPSNLTASFSEVRQTASRPPHGGKTTLRWNAPAEDVNSVTGYQILRGVAGAPLSIIEKTTGSTLTDYTDTWASRPGMTYTYQVKTVRGEELSDGSNEASVTIPQSCADGGAGFNVSPVHVAVTAVPIVVASTTADYFVLFVRPDPESYREIPISVTLGMDGTTTLTDGLAPLSIEHYRVEKYPVATPGDVDGDCASDIDELADVGTKHPLNRSASVAIDNGAVAIPDRATFERLSFKGRVSIDTSLNNLEFVKFFIYYQGTDRAGIYFQNTKTHLTHHGFRVAVGFDVHDSMKGDIIYHPNVVAPDGSLGVYRLQFESWESRPFEDVYSAYEMLTANMPLLENNLAYYPMPEHALPLYHREKAKYDASRINVVLDEDIFPDTDFISLNQGTGFGLLRVMAPDERPNPRDIVIYEALPNDLPRVAGIITSVPQTPLSHVNLRALQDGVPNGFIRDALDDTTIDSLIDSHVRYTVTRNGYTIRAATKTEVDAHYEASRPAAAQTPVRDLSVTAITALSEVAFGDWDAFGVKAANVAVLGTLGFTDGTVPDGFAVPFYFYDEFMKSNDLDAMVTTMLADADFQASFDTQEEKLDELRDAIKDATTPAWIITALEEMHAEFADGTSLRYRSSTNNEDLPGFSGAGLYDSKTQDPDETEEDGIDKSIKGVWASLWNFRAFVERDFNRIDHNATAMGVLVHPNYSDELANGVAVSHDPFSNRAGAYYVNTQIGEDLVTNPQARSVPEELLFLSDGSYDVIVYSNQVASGQLLMSDAQLEQLRNHLSTIHDRFKALYAPAVGERFAMEIEFKITSDNVLAIKQARPWVFRPINGAPTFPDTESGVRSIPELTRRNTAIGAPVAATDAEGDTMTYTLSGAGAEWFRVDISSGQLLTEKLLDFETQERHDVDITVGDPFNAEATTITVTINVTDVDEPADITFTEGSNVTATDNALTVFENHNGRLATFTASDPENTAGLTYQWTVVGTDGGDFTFTTDSDTLAGELSFAAVPDYERPADGNRDNTYNITVQALDSEGKTGRITVAVTVLPVNEPPALSGPSAVEFVEGGDDSVGAYAALDADGDEVSWSVGGADAASFEISAEGVLRFLSPPDFDAPGDADGDNAYQVQVRVTDGKDTAGESDAAVDATVEVTVSVIDANEPPTWSVVAGPARVVEGAASTVTVSVDKAFEVDQTITLAVGGTAASGDYSLSSSLLTLAAGDMSVTASVTAVDDSDEESDETVVVTASHGGGAVGSATVTIEANDTPVSTDAALSSLALSGVSIGDFDAGITAYAASVGNGVSSTTVTAVASDDGASVVIADGDGETQGTSRSVSLVVGDNEITVTVTAEDAATTKTYTVTVARAEPAVAPLPPGVVWGDRLPDRDIALPGASSSSGVWSDGTDVWVVTDTAAGKISVYSLADGAEHTDRGFTLPGGAEYAAGLWSDGATLWVADVNSGSVRAYRLSDGARQADRDLDTAGNGEPAGIWSDGTTMWAADFTDSRVYAYDLTTKARVADKELDLDKNPGETYNPFGIWSNADTLLAASWFGGEIIAHSLADGQRQPAKDLSTYASRTNFPNGIWSNGHILWVVDASAATLYAYAVPGLGTPPNDTPVWSVTAVPARVVEGAVSTVTVSVDKEFEVDQTITLAATGGTAASGDYSLSSSLLTLAAGDMSVTASVTAVDDSVIEGGVETVVVTASHGGGAVGSATVTIQDNDTAVWSVVAGPARVVEGAASTVTVSVGKGFEVDQTITLAATGGTAASGDYSLSSSLLTLAAGDMSVTASVTAVDDSVIEGGDETVVVTASHGGGAVGSATVTIQDNDTAVWSVVAGPARVVEGAASTVTVSVDKGFEVDQTITLAATGGTAASGDYSLSSSSLTLAAGDMSVTATVTAVDDSVIEGGVETVVVTASHGGGAVGSATVTIEDNDTAVWSVTAVPARVAEGAASTVTVSVDKEFEVDQTITLAVGGTAASGDYSLSSSSLTLAAGDMSVTATVTAVDDSDEESDETVVVTASHGGGAVGSATVTIQDNDTPTWSVTAVPARVVEGAASTVTVSVDKGFEVDQTITLAVGGTAASGDYSLSSSLLTLAAGDMSVTASVTAVDDSVIEGGVETVVVTASHGGGAVGSATVTIQDNDTPTWSVTAVPARVVEGAASTVTVSVDKGFEVDQTITLAVGGTAASGDYSLSSSLLTLAAGDMSVTATVTAVDDSVIEGGVETVVVTASHGGGAVGSATVTIQDNDTAVWSVVAGPARVVEGAASTVTVSVDKEFEVDQTITLAVGGTAASGDYSLSSSLLTLAAGDMSVTATVTAVDDSVIEGGDETVVVTASHGGGAVGSATVTIEDNDTPTWSVVAGPARVVEGAASTVTVSVDKEFEVDQTITLAVGGTAASGDYSLSSSLLTLAAGDMSVTASVTAVDDSDEESDETVVVTASHGGGAVGSATVTIEANDTPVSTDAALSSLALSGVSIGDFDAGITAYAASVGNGVSSTTVTAVASDDGASVVIADGDGETQGTSRSVSLVVGDNEITVTVTAEDAATTKTYTVTVARAEPAVAPLPPGVVWGDRLPDRDIALPGASSSSGVWSDGTDVWVVTDTAAGKISVYSLADGAEHTDRGFTLPGGAEYAAGLWSDGATLWVADVNSGSVRAYRLSDGARQADRDLDTAGNGEPAGIWSDGTTMWAADFTDSRVYAYDLTTKARVADKELDLDKNPGETYNPFGIWSNADTLLAASWFGGEIIAHSLADGQRQPAKDLSTYASRTNFPNGIWSNGHILWVVDASAATLYAYAVPGLGTPPNDTPVWSVTAVPARVVEGAASTVTVSVDKEFEVDQTITLAVGGTAASGDYSLSSSSLTLDAGDMSVTATVTAVDDSVIEGGDETVVVTASHGGGAVGSATVTIQDNDTAVWSVVAGPARVVEGAASTVTVSVGKEFEVDQTITLAATGGTAASGDYSLSSSSLTLDAGDTSVTATVTAVDDSVIEGGDETVVVTASHGGGAVGSATVTIQDNDTAVWSVTAVPARVVEGAASTVTVSVDKEFEVDQTITLAATGGTAASGDYSLSSSSLTLDAGDTSVTATVTAVDDSVIEGGDETVVVTASHGGGAVGSATVTIQDNDTPTWSVTAVPARVVEGAASTVTVSVDKEFEVDQTITLAVGGTAASGDYSLSSSSLTLDAGDMSVTATVTAVDDSDEESDETVVVTASHGGGAVGSATVTIQDNDTPTWSVTAGPARVVEGAASTVTVSVDKEFEVDQTITLAATGGTAASGDYSLSSSSLTLAAGDTSVTATVTAVDDSVIEGGDETVVVTASHGGGAVGSATVTIQDNDTAVWSVTAVPARVVEGAASTVTVSVDKEFEVDQTITLAVGGTAASGDYSLSSSLTLHAGDMSVTATVTAVDDSVIEGGDETVVVTASHGGGAVGSATVTIEDNDTAVWSVTAVPARVVEGAASTVTVSVDKEFEVDQTITLAATGGTAASGDYSLSSSSLTLAAGDTSVTATVTAVDDSVIEGGDETVVVTASHGGGAVGSATVTIQDNDTPTWSVVAGPARVAEGAASTVTVSVDKAFEVDQTITLAVGGTAASGDYSLSSSSLTLAAGDTSVTATVTAVDDSDEESDETVVVTASHGGGAVGSATVTIEANDTPVSTDAALSSLALSGVSIGDFDAGITAYAASVGNGVSSTTVTAVASDDGASVVIADGDGETQGTSRSVSLVVGDNEITVTVTAEDAATTKTYTVTVARAEPAVAPLPPGVVWGDRLPDRDIALPGASSSSGVWSDGTDVWVVTDTAAGKISVYSLADGAEHTDRGFTLPGGAEYAAGLWSDGATLWVADVNSGSVRAYRLSDGARQADRDLDTAGNGEPAGIWSDGTTMWVADFTDSRVYAYDLTTKARVADKELDLDKNPGETYNPFGIWSNADTLLAASWLGGEIIAHSLADGQRQPAKDLSTYASRTYLPNGIWSNGHILWVVDASAATLYAYAVPGLGTPPNDTAG